MWAALRSDLREFVSTVADDASSALTKIDAKLDEGDDDDDDDGVNKDNNNTNEDEETEDLLPHDSQPHESAPATTRSTTPPPPSNNNTNKTSNSQVFMDADGNVAVVSHHDTTTFASTGSPADEVVRLSTLEETYLEALQVETDDDFVELKDFLTNFSVEAKTEEISHLLETNPNLQHQFETLVPTQVKYEDFWQRYFFRCNEERIARQWQQEDEAEEQAQQATSTAAFAGGLLSVRSLFGGALSAMSQTLEAIDDDNDNNNPGGEEPVATTSSFPGLNIFGSSGRPPFVMNTAVDESFDDSPPPEEEELGWDDEEEDDGQAGGSGGGGRGDDDDDDGDEEIEFKDDAKEQLQKQLAQAIDERDQLHHTVELQRNEIATLKLSQSSSNDVQTLQMELFEKNSELAALKASLEDTHDDDDDGNNNNQGSKKDAARLVLQQQEIERLSNELSEKECELLELKQQLRKVKAELQEKAETTLPLNDETAALALEEARALNIKLQSKLAAALEQAQGGSVVKNENDSHELEATRAELQAAQALLQQSNSRMEELFTQLEASKQHAAALELQLTASAATGVTAVVAAAAATTTTTTTTSATKEEDSSDQALLPAKVAPVAAAAPLLPQEQQQPDVIQPSMSPDSSTSTGVKVRVADDSVRPAATGGKEEDDWGDDWGDDDDVDVN